MTTSNSIVSSQVSLPTEQKLKGRGNKIVVGMAVKAKIGELEEEVRAGSSRRMRKELTGVVQGVSGRRRFLVRFQNGCENNLFSNQLTAVIVEKIPEEKEPEVSEIAEIPEEQVELEKGYYRCFYVMLRFKKKVGVDSKEEQADVEDDPDEDEMDDVNLDDKRERHWRMAFEYNDGGVDDAKALLHAKRWDIYANEKEKLVKGGYSVEVVGNDKKKVLWEVVDDHVLEEPTDHEEIGLRGFDFNYFDEDEEGVVREGSSDFPYLPMLINIFPGYWKNQLKRMNQKVY